MAKQKRVKYFAYGSNLSPAWIKDRCPSSKFLGVAVLKDYEIKFLYPSTSWPPGGAADIVAKEGSETWGVLYTMNESDLGELDKYEDVEKGGYRRIELELETTLGPEKAFVYEVVSKLEKELAPERGYAELVLNGALAHGLPRYYYKLLEFQISRLQSNIEGELV